MQDASDVYSVRTRIVAVVISAQIMHRGVCADRRAAFETYLQGSACEMKMFRSLDCARGGARSPTHKRARICEA